MNTLTIKKIDLKSIFRGVDEKAYDLVMKCLRFDPLERITAEDILRHPYV